MSTPRWQALSKPSNSGKSLVAFWRLWRSERALVMASSKLQDSVRERLQTILQGFTFHENYRPDWMRNPETGRNLELDFYLPDAKVAIEVQGQQHFVYVPGFHADEGAFRAQQRRDSWKREVCQNRKISLYEVRTLDDIDAFLREASKAHGRLFDILLAKNAAILRVNSLAHKLRIASKSKDAPQRKVEIHKLTQKMLALCAKFNIPLGTVRADPSIRSTDMNHPDRPIVVVYRLGENGQIRTGTRATVLSVTGNLAILRFRPGKSRNHIFDCEFDLTTGRSTAETEWGSSWVIRPDLAAKLMEHYQSVNTTMRPEQLRELRLLRAKRTPYHAAFQQREGEIKGE